MIIGQFSVFSHDKQSNDHFIFRSHETKFLNRSQIASNARQINRNFFLGGANAGTEIILRYLRKWYVWWMVAKSRRLKWICETCFHRRSASIDLMNVESTSESVNEEIKSENSYVLRTETFASTSQRPPPPPPPPQQPKCEATDLHDRHSLPHCGLAARCTYFAGTSASTIVLLLL